MCDSVCVTSHPYRGVVGGGGAEGWAGVCCLVCVGASSGGHFCMCVKEISFYIQDPPHHNSCKTDVGRGGI